MFREFMYRLLRVSGVPSVGCRDFGAWGLGVSGFGAAIPWKGNPGIRGFGGKSAAIVLATASGLAAVTAKHGTYVCMHARMYDACTIARIRACMSEFMQVGIGMQASTNIPQLNTRSICTLLTAHNTC